MNRPGLMPLLEALLFASDQPLSLAILLRALDDGDVTADDVREALEHLAQDYDARARGMKLVKLGSGYQVVTREEYAPWIKNLLAGRQRTRLSRAALETAAVIAYKQPLTRLGVERIRGVDAGGVLNTLLERGLVMIKGRDPGPGRPLLYGTTQTFLDYFGLSKLSDLPNMSEIAALARAESSSWDEDERERFTKHGLEPESVAMPLEFLEAGDVAGDREAFHEMVAGVGESVLAEAGADTEPAESSEDLDDPSDEAEAPPARPA